MVCQGPILNPTRFTDCGWYNRTLHNSLTGVGTIKGSEHLSTSCHKDCFSTNCSLLVGMAALQLWDKPQKRKVGESAVPPLATGGAYERQRPKKKNKPNESTEATGTQTTSRCLHAKLVTGDRAKVKEWQRLENPAIC